MLVEFFAARPRQTDIEMPGLDPAIEALSIELARLDVAGQHDLMRTMGLAYRPALLYRVSVHPRPA